MDSKPVRPRYILDASVAVKWYLRDEDDLDAADAVLTDFREDRIQLFAPEHLRYEVPSAFRNALRQGRLDLDQARRAIVGFLNWQIPTERANDHILAACDQAVRYGCSLYDGLYPALAEGAGCPLIFADQRLRNALGSRFPLALWLTDYVPRSTQEQVPE